MRGWLHSLIAVVLFSPAALADKPIAVLVPGFFNSLADGSSKGPYFSKNIVKTVEDAGYEVFVVDNLLPLGHIEENSKRLIEYLKAIKDKPAAAEYGLTLIAHSAGGLYSLKALTLEPTLPVRALATIATPYAGINFITRLSDQSVVRELVNWFHLDSLLELTQPAMRGFLQTVKVPEGVRVVVAAGEQGPCGLLSCTKAENLSWVMSITGDLNGQASDGIVPLNSALGFSGATVRMADKIKLEHWEQVLDYKTFAALGVTNPKYVRDEQRRFYTALLGALAPR